MRVPQFERSSPLTPNLTPMVDVVFQLIVFFVATSTLARYEFTRGLTLPEARSGHPVDTTRSLVTVNALPDGTLVVGGKPIAVGRLEQLLRQRVEEQGAENVTLYIRSDANTRYGAVAPVLLAAARAGIWQVRLAVRQDEAVGAP